MESPRKRALVTGGTRGIGKAIVKELASQSCCGDVLSDIVFTYNSCEECAKEIEREIGNNDVKVYAVKANASSSEEAQASVDYVVKQLGGIDILINNAGITRDNLLMRMPETDFDKVLEVNLKSVFNYTKAATKHMVRQRYGRIVNISSVVGVIGNAGQSNYSASKAGIIGFTKSVAKELASRNITVNAIAPGFIETEMTAKLNEKQREVLMQNVPLKRMGKPEDIARVVGFLCSDAADYITGQVINVDGGMVM